MQLQERGQDQSHCLFTLFLCYKSLRGRCHITVFGVQGVTLQQCSCWQSEPCVLVWWVPSPVQCHKQVYEHSISRQEEEVCHRQENGAELLFSGPRASLVVLTHTVFMLLIKQLECTNLVSSFCLCSLVGLSVCSEGITYNKTANK